MAIGRAGTGVRVGLLAAADVPPGYPVTYERRLRLRDGRAAFLRPIVLSDAPALAAAIAAADPDTLRSAVCAR